MKKIIGSIKDLPKGTNLNTLPLYMKQNPFYSAVTFRCLCPEENLGYPIFEKGLLTLHNFGDRIYMLYLSELCCYITDVIILEDYTVDNTLRWYIIQDSKQGRIFDKNGLPSTLLKTVSDDDIKTLVNRYLVSFSDSYLGQRLAMKMPKETLNQYADGNSSILEREKGITIKTNKGVIVKGQGIKIGSANNGQRRGITVLTPTLNRESSIYVERGYQIYDKNFESEGILQTVGTTTIASRNRPMIETPSEFNRGEVALRSDVRWKLFYSGREGRKEINYPIHAKEVLVQVYTDVGGRIWRNGGTIWRDLGYKEFPPMHFINRINNVINQDTGFIEHDSSGLIRIRHIGEDNVNNARNTRLIATYTGGASNGVSPYVHYPSIRRLWWR